MALGHLYSADDDDSDEEDEGQDAFENDGFIVDDEDGEIEDEVSSYADTSRGWGTGRFKNNFTAANVELHWMSVHT